MDSPASALSRAGRTFWTVWNYLTEVVGRYLSPEPTNIGTNDTNSRQEVTAAPQTEDHVDGAKNEIKATEVTFEIGSELKKPQHVVAWEQCNVIIGPGLGRENVQYTGQSNRGSDSKASHEEEDIKQEQVDQAENKDTIQHVTKEELNMGKGVQSVLFTGVQILFREPTSERSKDQGAQGHAESYNCAEANRLRGEVAARKEEEEEVTEEFHCGEEGTKTEEHENNRDGELHFDIESPNLTSACAEPAALLDKNRDEENKDRLTIHDEQSTEDETMVRFNEKVGEEETAVLFMETDKEGWNVAEIVEFSGGGENSDDMEELRRKEESEEENGTIEEMDTREQEEILDGDFGPYNDFKVSENNNKHEYGDNRLKFDEGTIEKLDQENDPNPRLLCEGLSDEDRKLGRGQDIFASEAELELQIAYDKRVFVSNDEITVVTDEQRMECNIERIDSPVLEDGSKVIEDGGTNKIEDVVINIGTKVHTEAEDVKDKVTGLNTFFDQERNKLEEEKISKEDEDPLNEVEEKLISVVDTVEDNNRVEIRGVAKYISLGLCEEPVVAQEPKHVACEETPEINNGKELDENTAPKILEVDDDDDVNTTHLQEVHTDSDTKQLESVENTGTSFKSDNSPVSELMEGKEDPKTVEGLFESEDIENASDTVVDERAVEKAAKSLWETERTDSVLLNETDIQILEDLARIDASPSDETEAGIVDTEARMFLETTVIESELLEELPETESGSQKDKEVKRHRTETEPSVETDVEELVESEAGDTVETEVGLVRTVAELPEEVRPKIELLEKMNRTGADSSEDTDETEARFSEEIETDLVETKYGLQKDMEEDILHVRTETVLSVETVKTDTDSSDESLESRSLEISEAGLSEESVDGEAGLQEIYTEIPDVEKESGLSEETIDAGLSEKTDVPDTEFVKNTEAGLMLEAELSDETEAGIVDTEARIFLETTVIESELLEELPETESGSQKDKEVKRQRTETEPLVETDVEELVESEAGETVETEVGLVRTVAKLPEEVRPKIELLEKMNRTGADSSEDTDETEARFSEEIETDLVETKYGLQKDMEEDILHVRTETVLSVETVKTDTDSSDESLESRSLEISEAGLSEELVDSEAGLQEIYTEIPDVEKESGLSEETVDAGLSEKTDVPDTEFVKNTEAGLMLEAELSDETEAVLKEKTEDNMPNKSLEIEGGLFWETDETEALVTEEVVKTGPGVSKQTDFGSQGQLLEIEVGVIEKSQVEWSEETVETDAGLPEENRGDGAKAGFSSPSGIKNVDQNLQLQFDASALDFTAQKSRIALKNPHARPPRDPRTLLQMPSLTPSPSKPTVHVPVRGPIGIPMRGMGGIGIKLPGLSASGLTILRKTEKGVRDEKNTENIPQKSEIEQDVRDESPKKEETQNKQEERKTKWTPPRHPGFGSPLMMNELKNKLKKTTKESGDD